MSRSAPPPLAIGLVLLATTLVAGQAHAETSLVAQPAPAGADGADEGGNRGVRVFGRVGGIFLHRSDNDTRALIEDPATGARLLDAGAFDLGWQPGLEAVLGVGSGAFDVEVRLFEVGVLSGDWSERTSVDPPAIVQFNTDPPLFGLGLDAIDARLSSELASVEANVRWRALPYLSVIAGLRYLELDDDLVMHTTFAGGSAVVGMRTRNTLFGPQVGLEGRYPVGRWVELQGWIKGAFLHNRARNRFEVEQTTGPAFEAEDVGRDSAWAAEAGADVLIAFTPWMGLTLGYQVLWIGEVATVTDQLSRVDVLTSTARPKLTDLLLHGPRAALEFRFGR